MTTTNVHRSYATWLGNGGIGGAGETRSILGSAVAAVASSVSAGLGGCAVTEDALGKIYQQYAPAIYAHCRRLLQSPSAARDAMQEAFVRLLARRLDLASDEDTLRYLYRVSTNVSLNQLRERRVHARARPELMARSSSSPSAETGQADRQFVAALLERCDETGAAVAAMHYVDGMSQVEIAEVLGITRRTVFNRLRKLEVIAEALMGGDKMGGETGGGKQVDNEGEDANVSKKYGGGRKDGHG